MKRYKQQIKHDPLDGQYGDCARTVIACLLEIEPSEVPHFFDGPDEQADEQWQVYRSWLHKQGIRRLLWIFSGEHALEDVLECMFSTNPDVWYVLQGRSAIGANHNVICRNNRIVHDPATDSDHSIVGPSREDNWCVFVYVRDIIGGEE